METITPVVMAGGSGSRLWPMSRAAHPKQFHALVSETTMLDATLARVEGAPFAPPMIIGSADHADRLIASLEHPSSRVVLEPFGRNTAPAAIAAALLVAEGDPDGLVLLLPADHHIADIPAFLEVVERGVAAARLGYLVTLGITPERPETGYGYIKRKDQLTDGVFSVEAFVEKPNQETAQAYLDDGSYSWNAGIFLFRASDLLAEARRYASEILAATKATIDNAHQDGQKLLLDADDFAAVPSDSIDYAIMERTDKAAVVSPVTIGWSDIGSWEVVKAFADKDTAGDVIAVDCQNSMIRSSGDGPLVAAIGLEGFVVVATKDTVLICPEERSQEVKTIVETLKEQKRSDLL